MKRRKFLQSAAAVTAATIVAPAMLISKSIPVDDVYRYDLPMPTLEPGDIGVIYGNIDSGKSTLLNKMFLNDPNDPSSVLIFTSWSEMYLTSIIRTIQPHYNSIYIDDFNLLDTSHSKHPLKRNLYLLQKLAKGQKLKVWITLQAHQTALVGYKIFPPATFSFAAIIHTEFLYGWVEPSYALLKYRYGRTGIMWNGLPDFKTF